MQDEARADLSRARLALAKERIGFAREILKLGDYKTVANRSNYWLSNISYSNTISRR